MVESNFQRSHILPSEKDYVYKMRLEAMNKQAGRPQKNNLTPVVSENLNVCEQTSNWMQKLVKVENKFVDISVLQNLCDSDSRFNFGYSFATGTRRFCKVIKYGV